jgi:hypothetical protein
VPSFSSACCRYNFSQADGVLKALGCRLSFKTKYCDAGSQGYQKTDSRALLSGDANGDGEHELGEDQTCGDRREEKQNAEADVGTGVHENACATIAEVALPSAKRVKPTLVGESQGLVCRKDLSGSEKTDQRAMYVETPLRTSEKRVRGRSKVLERKRPC